MEEKELEFAGSYFKEDKTLSVDLSDVRSYVDEFRQEVIQHIRKNNPDKMKDIVKITKKFDDVFAELEKLIKQL
jgi:hypothetical protein